MYVIVINTKIGTVTITRKIQLDLNHNMLCIKNEKKNRSCAEQGKMHAVLKVLIPKYFLKRIQNMKYKILITVN